MSLFFLLTLALAQTPEREALASSIQELAVAFHEEGAFDGAVLVVYDGELLFEGGFGLANREWSVPNAPDTIFNLGSCAKPLTASLILHLVGQGLLSLDEPIGRWLPELRADLGERITVGYEPVMATGAPDARPQDDPLAWASETKDDQPEWLELDYASDEVVRPVAVHVFESQNPGAVSGFSLFGSKPEEAAPFDAEEFETRRSERGVHVAVFPVYADFPVTRVRLELDSPGVAGWNEIDAVGLEDESGTLHWATGARASSTASDLIALPWDATPRPADLERIAGNLRDCDRVGEAEAILALARQL